MVNVVKTQNGCSITAEELVALIGPYRMNVFSTNNECKTIVSMIIVLTFVDRYLANH